MNEMIRGYGLEIRITRVEGTTLQHQGIPSEASTPEHRRNIAKHLRMCINELFDENSPTGLSEGEWADMVETGEFPIISTPIVFSNPSAEQQ
jgi:hypothetical protein